jgi:hypothetical protein
VGTLGTGGILGSELLRDNTAHEKARILVPVWELAELDIWQA